MAISPEILHEILKKEMKNKKMKYEDLAQKLGLSLSGLKKSLASKDLTLARLQSICEVLAVPMVQILTLADDSKVQDVYLTNEQEDLLLRNPEIFHLYWKLRFDEMPLYQYIQQKKESREEIRARLRRLEKVGLIKIDARGELEFSDRGMIRWNNFGPLVQYLNRKWSSELIDSILAKKDANSALNLALLQLSENALGELRADLRGLVDRYSTRSRQDKAQAGSVRLKKVALLVAADEHQFVK